MKKRVFSIFVALVMVFSYMFLLTGCSKNKEKNVSQEELTSQQLESKADVIILGPNKGADCIEYTNYYISFSESKVYKYEYFIVVPLEDASSHVEHKPDIKITEYEIDKNDIKEINTMVENLKDDTKKSYYKVKVDGKVYNIDDEKSVRELIKKIEDR